jgi:hypothetical protein
MVKIREYFVPNLSFHKHTAKFFSLNLNEKSMRYAFLSKSEC